MLDPMYICEYTCMVQLSGMCAASNDCPVCAEPFIMSDWENNHIRIIFKSGFFFNEKDHFLRALILR